MIIAIDFDGTIAEHHPTDQFGIGPALPGAIETLKELQKRHTLILWTCRGGKFLSEAKDWLIDQGIYFNAYNESVHALTSRGEVYYPRKVFAHMYIDDRAFGGFPGWEVIREQLLGLEGV